jgi:serralysin
MTTNRNFLQPFAPGDETAAQPDAISYNAGPVLAAPLPVYSTDQIADYLTDGYWTDAGFSPAAFDLAANGGVLTYDVSLLTPAGQTLARAAIQAWEEVSGITFVEVSTGGTNADIIFDDADPSGAYSQSVISGGSIVTSYVNIPTIWLTYYGTSIDSYAYQTYLHEIGHALGLGHAGDYNGAATYPNDALYANDSWQATVMSYFSPYWDNTYIDASDGFAITPMIADIVAIQNLYGPPGDTRLGDTTYGDGNNTGNAIFGLTGTSLLTIYDSGGTDTINLASRANAQRLDLTPESISDINGRIGNLSIARGTVIENAVTGAGNDTIIGNSAANLLIAGGGNDDLFGDGGNDRLEGGDGADSIDGGDGDDELLGQSGNDTLMGGEGDDNISSSDGNDLADGGGGNDRMGGGFGNDTMDGGLGNDFMGGGDDDDIVRGGPGRDVVNGGKGNDRLEGGDDADTMGGSYHNDTIYGDGGNDNIGGGAGADLIYAGTGNDSIGGGPGIDTIYGEAGNDFLAGGDGGDLLYGGDDNDRINGGAGNDTMDGGAGADTFVFNAFNAGEEDLIQNFEDGVDHFVMVGVDGDSLQGRLDALNITDTATGVSMTYDGHVIYVEGVSAADLTLDDFTFV